jgi:hypothetical protein
MTRERFHQLMARCVDVPINDIAREFTVSRPTVIRWFCGITAPATEKLRHEVIKWIARRTTRLCGAESPSGNSCQREPHGNEIYHYTDYPGGGEAWIQLHYH